MRMLKTREEQGILPPQPAPREAHTQTTYIDQGCEIVGELRFGEGVRIDGQVEGAIRARKTVVVGENAQIRARIEAETIVVHGSVEGDVVASAKITLHKTASVNGEIRTAGIVVEEGARLNGCIVIGSDDAPKPAPAKTAPAAKAAPPARPAPAPAAALSK